MPFRFHKMHGLGNDFVVLDLRDQDLALDEDLAKTLSDRHTGVGCDQIMVLRPAADPAHLAAFEIWNADGSRAEQCGNGVRCLGRYLQLNGDAPAGPFQLGGPASVIRIECLEDGMVRVDMGAPDFSPDRVPVRLAAADGWYPLEIEREVYRVGAVSMGNPHALLLVDDIDAADVAGLGPAIGGHPAFPRGCNAGFAQIVDRGHIRLRVYERGGAGETSACGSGSCAAMSILRKAGLVDITVRVTQKGGSLIIAWTGGEDSVIMTGPATHVYTGIFE
jgi:diaminopimelate epimerase